MAFHPSALYKTQHLSWDRANGRQIQHSHALLCASEGIEHSQQPNSISHDVALPESPDVTLRIVTTADKKVGLTGYYLSTERAVREREAFAAKQRHAQGVAKDARAAATATTAKTSASKKKQRANQLLRLHSDGKHAGKPDTKCPGCNPSEEVDE